MVGLGCGGWFGMFLGVRYTLLVGLSVGCLILRLLVDGFVTRIGDFGC